MNAILLDAHIFIWYVNGNAMLNKRSQNLIDSAMHSNDLYLSAISL